MKCALTMRVAKGKTYFDLHNDIVMVEAARNSKRRKVEYFSDEKTNNALAVLALCTIPTQACWFASKENTLKRSQKFSLPRIEPLWTDPSIEAMCKEMPAPFAWATRQIGIEPAFKDCDENEDGTIPWEEMESMDTCLTDCTKLTILNMVMWL